MIRGTAVNTIQRNEAPHKQKKSEPTDTTKVLSCTEYHILHVSVETLMCVVWQRGRGGEGEGRGRGRTERYRMSEQQDRHTHTHT